MNYADLDRWFKDNGDNTLRVNYNLDEGSLVIDLGGYHGGWTDKIINKYNCNVIIFEPINELYKNLKKRYENNPKIKVLNYGISDYNGTKKISLQEDGSSFYRESENSEECNILSVIDFLLNEKIEKVNLIKINVEGDEFPILKSLIEKNFTNIFDNIQVQFHQFIPNSEELRLQIHESLSKTHKLTYNYEFVWENWEKK